MSTMQLVLASGAAIGLGLTLMLWRFVPADPDLADTLSRLASESARPGTAARAGNPAGPADVRDVLGRWAERNLPTNLGGGVSSQDLAILRVSSSRFLGEKVMFALMGLFIAPLLSGAALLIGIALPVVVPVAGSVGLAVVMWFIPTYNAVDDAKKARVEFSRALGAYIDLVALERNAGSGPRQSMEAAAAIGDSWVFRRIGEELARTRWSGVTPWEAMRHLDNELGIADLNDLADIMRLSSEDGAEVYAQLRARSASMRSAMLNAEKAQANEVSERMTLPMAVLGMIFLVILIAPAMLRFAFGEL